MKDTGKILNDYLQRYYRGDPIRQLFEELREESYDEGFTDGGMGDYDAWRR